MFLIRVSLIWFCSQHCHHWKSICPFWYFCVCKSVL